MGNCLQPNNWDALDDDDIRTRYLLRNRAQACALKRLCAQWKLPLSCVDRVYKSFKDSFFDISGDFVSKKNFLHHVDIVETPFSVGALNTLTIDDKVEFFSFFSAVANFNTYDRNNLIAFTFTLCDETGTGRLTEAELAVLVHFVYGTHVAKSEVGFIITNNTTDIETAALTMKNLDPERSGFVTLAKFSRGVNKHANLLAPAFNVQQDLRRATGGSSFWKKLTAHITKQSRLLDAKFSETFLRLKKGVDLAEDAVAEANNAASQHGLRGGAYDLGGNLREASGAARKAKLTMAGTRAFGASLRDNGNSSSSLVTKSDHAFKHKTRNTWKKTGSVAMTANEFNNRRNEPKGGSSGGRANRRGKIHPSSGTVTLNY